MVISYAPIMGYCDSDVLLPEFPMTNNGHGNHFLKEEIESGSPDMNHARLPGDNQKDSELITNIAEPHMSDNEYESNAVADGTFSRRPRRNFSLGFKVALFRELQRDNSSNPFRSHGRDDRRQSWDALAERLKSLTRVEVNDGVGNRTLEVQAPINCDGYLCRRIFIAGRSLIKSKQVREEPSGSDPASQDPEDQASISLETQELEAAMKMVEVMVKESRSEPPPRIEASHKRKSTDPAGSARLGTEHADKRPRELQGRADISSGGTREIQGGSPSSASVAVEIRGIGHDRDARGPWSRELHSAAEAGGSGGARGESNVADPLRSAESARRATGLSVLPETRSPRSPTRSPRTDSGEAARTRGLLYGASGSGSGSGSASTSASASRSGWKSAPASCSASGPASEEGLNPRSKLSRMIDLAFEAVQRLQKAPPSVSASMSVEARLDKMERRLELMEELFLESRCRRMLEPLAILEERLHRMSTFMSSLTDEFEKLKSRVKSINSAHGEDTRRAVQEMT